MHRRVRVFRFLGDWQGVRRGFLLAQLPQSLGASADLPQGFEELGIIELGKDEEWKGRLPELTDKETHVVNYEEDPDAVPATLSEAEGVLVKTPLEGMRKFEIYEGPARFGRNAAGKPTRWPRMYWTVEGRDELADDDDFEHIRSIELEADDAAQLKGEVLLDIHRRGAWLKELDEEEIKEDPDTIYFFTEKAPIQRKKDQPSKFYLRGFFTKDFLGENLPVWFVKSDVTGAYPERVPEQDWDLAAIRRELEEKPYVMGELVVGVNPAEVEREMTRRGHEASNDAVESALDKLYGKLK